MVLIRNKSLPDKLIPISPRSRISSIHQAQSFLKSLRSIILNPETMADPLPKIILVTGGNRSIGRAIVQQTALRYPSNTYIIGCRNVQDGEEAIAELRKAGIKASLETLELDVTSDKSVFAAVARVKERFGRLDVLINNAGVASIPEKADFSDFRSSFAETFDVNITSVALLTTCFLPLIRLSTAGKVINVSSGRASLHNSSTGNMPPTVAVAYSISKAALNSLTIEMQKVEDAEGPQGSDVRIFAINPGHCKTSFNGFRGTKDPIDGAAVVVRIVGDEKGDYGKGRFWEFEEGVMREVPW